MSEYSTLSASNRRKAVRKTHKAVLFYDGECPLCSREIAHYPRRRGSEAHAWVDVSQASSQLEKFGLSQSAAMTRFHVLDKDGRWHTGAWGFAELWSHLSAYRWLASLVRRLRLLPLLDVAYGRLAQWRLRRRCQPASCNRGASLKPNALLTSHS